MPVATASPCRECGGAKTLAMASDGRRKRWSCLPCLARAQKAKRLANPEYDRMLKRRSYAKCIEKTRVRDRARYSPEKYRTYMLRSKFGLTRTEFATLLIEQNGQCPICSRQQSASRFGVFVVDHDRRCCPGKRSCGKCIRGLLCNRCNRAVGLFRDDPALLEAGAAYLRRRA